MKLAEFQEMLRREEVLDREGLEAVLGSNPERAPTVRKYEAKHWAHLKEVVAIADDECPRAADTIRWLLWWTVSHSQRMVLMADDIKEEPTP